MRRALTSALILLLAVLAVALATVVAPADAAQVWEEGTTGHPFALQPVPAAVSVLGGDDQRLGLAQRTLDAIDKSAPMWDFYPDSDRPDPRTVYPLPNHHLLISGGKNVNVPYVLEVDADGNVVWEYTNGADGHLVKPFSAEPATFGGRRCVLISDRNACRVFAVDRETKQVVWQYGTTDVEGAGVNQVADAFCATQLDPIGGQIDGNVLIADSNVNNRVIEVRADDYDPSAPSLGYDASSIVWQYGVTGQVGTAPGYLQQARSPQRLANGDTLITDAVSKRILRIRSADYRPDSPDNGYSAGSIVWSYEDGVDGTLVDPNTARYIQSGALAGNLLVTDAKAGCVKVISLDDAKRTVETIDLNTWERPAGVDPSDGPGPRDARVAADGSMWIAEADFGRILQIGNEGTGTVTSEWLTCGEPDMVKAFVRLKIEAPLQARGTGFQIWYSRDGIRFVKAKVSADGRNINFPAGTWGTRFAYKVVLTSADRWASPEVGGLILHFSKAKTGGSGGGGGGDKPGGSGNSGGSGAYTYPSTAEGGTGTSGTGTGSGTYGTGSGSGSAGAGTGSSGTGTGTGSTSTANSLDVPVQSTGSGSAQAVEGYQVQGQEGVSGVPLRAVAGPQAPDPERPGPPVPVFALIGAGLFVLAAFFVPWPIVAAQMRRITGFDHTRPKGFLPFRPLGK